MIEIKGWNTVHKQSRHLCCRNVRPLSYGAAFHMSILWPIHDFKSMNYIDLTGRINILVSYCQACDPIFFFFFSGYFPLFHHGKYLRGHVARNRGKWINIICWADFSKTVSYNWLLIRIELSPSPLSFLLHGDFLTLQDCTVLEVNTKLDFIHYAWLSLPK